MPHAGLSRSINDTQNVRDLRDDAAHRRSVLPFDRLVQLGYAERLDDSFLLFRVADRAAIILYLDRAARFCVSFLCHFFV